MTFLVQAFSPRWQVWAVATAAAVLTGCAHQSSTKTDAQAPDLVPLSQVVPQAQQDMRYFGANNFMGRPIAGYEAPACWLSRPAAMSLAKVQQALAAQGMTLKVFDCYRPQTAVDDFVRWGKDLQDQKTKAQYYPNVPKEELFTRGYIAEKSGHSRASTVDLTVAVVDSQRASQVVKGPLRNGGEVDMGTPFDMFDVRSHTENPDMSPDVRHNRLWLRALMDQHGWNNLPEEWWHFTLRDEPYPKQFFDVPVRR